MKLFTPFLTGALQILLIVTNTYLISKGTVSLIPFVGMGISAVWLVNVNKARGSWQEKVAYVLGTGCGNLGGYYLGKLLFTIAA